MSDFPKVIFSPLLQSAGIPHGFFTRHMGVSSEQLDQLAKEGGDKTSRDRVELILSTLSAKTLALPKQVHGVKIWKPEKNDRILMRGPEADAVVSQAKKFAAGVITADCVPILIASKNGKIVAAVHGGWRGLDGQILELMIQEIKRISDIQPKNLIGAIGPSIGPCCYEVSEQLAEQFQKQYAESDDILRSERQKVLLNLQEIARLQMIKSGMTKENIEVMGICTGCHKDQFFSYRKEKGTDLRQVSAIAPKNE